MDVREIIYLTIRLFGIAKSYTYPISTHILVNRNGFVVFCIMKGCRRVRTMWKYAGKVSCLAATRMWIRTDEREQFMYELQYKDWWFL